MVNPIICLFKSRKINVPGVFIFTRRFIERGVDITLSVAQYLLMKVNWCELRRFGRKRTILRVRAFE